MRRDLLPYLLSVAVLAAVALLALATVSPPSERLVSAGLAVLLLAPWGLAVALGIRAGLRRDLPEALVALAVLLVALTAVLW